MRKLKAMLAPATRVIAAVALLVLAGCAQSDAEYLKAKRAAFDRASAAAFQEAYAETYPRA